MTQVLSECAHPDEWLVIPEFEVKPQVADFVGFEKHVYGPTGDLSRGESLIPLVAAARELIRVHFETMDDLKHVENEVLEMVAKGGVQADDAVIESAIEAMTESQSESFLYMTVKSELTFVTWRCDDDKLCFEVLALAASTLLAWVAHGPKEAAKHLRRTNSSNASMPRPAKRSGLKEAVLTAMKPHKENFDPFKIFLQNWSLGPITQQSEI
jgi:hypothetical protein